MNNTGLSHEIFNMMNSIFERHPEITAVVLFGSRAKGNFQNNSDIDLAISGIENDLSIEAISMELDALPLPYKFDVQSFASIKNTELREHIRRVGLRIYPKET